MNALLDGTWDQYLAEHPEAAEKPADGAAATPDVAADAAATPDAVATPDAPADAAPAQEPTERNTNVD